MSGKDILPVIIGSMDRNSSFYIGSFHFFHNEAGAGIIGKSLPPLIPVFNRLYIERYPMI
jgi:hypothetical protein